MGLLFVSDLDGTLLDHSTYSFAAAAEALDATARASIPLVLATSKTEAEVRILHRQMGLGDSHAIVENGAGIVRPGEAEHYDDTVYRTLLEALASVPSHLRGAFQGFDDLTDAQVSDLTGLPLQDARRARQRAYSEPGLWSGDASALRAFQAHLSERGITARSGGRFLTLSFGRTKADAMAEVASGLGATTVVALGDAPNDVEMLEAADIGVIIANPHGVAIPTLPGEATGRIRRSLKSGPSGWNTAVLEILEEVGSL